MHNKQANYLVEKKEELETLNPVFFFFRINRLLLQASFVLHAVGSGDDPRRADEGRSTHVPPILEVEADLPWKLPVIGILPTHDTRRLEGSLPTVCKESSR